MQLQVTDAGGRRHRLHLQLPPTFPASPPALAHPADLPQPLQLVLRQQRAQQPQQPLGTQQQRVQQLQQLPPWQQQQSQGFGGGGGSRGASGVLREAFTQFEQVWGRCGGEDNVSACVIILQRLVTIDHVSTHCALPYQFCVVGCC